MKIDKDLVGIVGQYGSMISLIIGIAIEVAMQAHLGFIFIASGGLAWGLFTKIRGK